MKVENLIRVGEKGECIPESMSSDERRRLYPPLGIVKVVKLTWSLDGVEYSLDLEGGRVNYEMLPDRSGFLVTKPRVNGKTQAMVLNADSSIRYTLDNPWPTHASYKVNQDYDFSLPLVERGQPGFVVSVSGVGPTGVFVNVDHFFAIDPNDGKFIGNHQLY